MGDKVPEVLGTTIVFFILPFIAVGLRFYSRYLRRAFGWDDWLMIPALGCTTASGIALFYGVKNAHEGQHYLTTILPPGTTEYPGLNDPNTVVYEKIKYVLTIATTICIGITKFSVILLYRRLFGREKWFKYVCDACLVIIFIWGVGFTFSFIFQCSPISAAWEVPEIYLAPYCIDVLNFYKILPITDIITDIMVLALPVPMVWGLQLPTKRKLAVGGMFFLGATVCIAGIARLVIFERDLHTFGSMDQRYVAADTIVWSYIEASLAIVSVCLPTLRPLFQKSESKTTGGSYTYGSNVTSNRTYSLKILHRTRDGHSRFDEESTTGFANNSEWDSPTVDRDANLGTSTQIESKRSTSLEAKKDPDGIRVERHFSNAREPYR